SRLEPYNRGRGIAPQLETESVNRPMAARAGQKQASKIPSASLKLSLVRTTATLFTQRFRAHSGAIRRTAVSTKQLTAARPGRKRLKDQTFPRVVRRSRSIRPIRT